MPARKHALITVIKRNPQAEETWRYSGVVVRSFPGGITLQAEFNRDDIPFHGILLRRGDRFVETFYTNRWYNIFEIHDVDDDRIKGWYCNIGKPAVLNGDELSYIDLALDLLVYPDGRQLVLDEEEFEALGLDVETKEKALAALEEVRGEMQKRLSS